MAKNKTIMLTSNTSWYLYNFRKSTILALIEAGYRPVCVAPRDEYSSKLEELGSLYHPLGVEGKSTNVFREFRVFLNLVTIIVRLKPAFVFNFTIKMNVYAGMASKLVGIPYSNNVSGLGTAFLHEGTVYKLAQFFYGLTNRFAKRVFFQNEDDMQLFLDRGLARKNSAILLPGSGIDLNSFPYQQIFGNSDTLSFLMIARVIADKGAREYVQAARIVKSKYPGVRFVLVGSWEVSNKSAIAAETILAWQKSATVELLGHQSDVKPFIYDSDVVVLPSYREGMPRTILEAASCGRPAIVTNVAGCKHSIVPGFTGWLCEVRSAASLAKCMEDCIHIGKLGLIKYGLAARQNIEANFSDQIVIRQYMALLPEAADPD